MAKISTIKKCVSLCRDAGITLFIWGERGIGKSSAVRQTALENGWGFIDMRASQIEASDLRGLPDRGEDGRTHYLPPADMPIGDLTLDEVLKQLGKEPDPNDHNAVRLHQQNLQRMQNRFENGILFLDEVNRAADDVLQAVFQLVLDRRVGQYVLPPGWTVVTAGNFMEGYMVSGFNDPAFLDRFCHVTMDAGESTLEEWVNYMTDCHGAAASDIIEFASSNTRHLDGELKGELGFSVQPSRRSWDSVARVIGACQNGAYDETTRHAVIAGLVGAELAASFSRHACPIKPRDIITQGVKKHEKKLGELNRGQLVGLMWGLVSHCKNNIEDDKYAIPCLDFAHYMAVSSNDKDLTVSFCRALIGTEGNEKVRGALISNPQLAKWVSKYNKSTGGKTTFLDRLNERPELQQILSRVSWGN